MDDRQLALVVIAENCVRDFGIGMTITGVLCALQTVAKKIGEMVPPRSVSASPSDASVARRECGGSSSNSVSGW